MKRNILFGLAAGLLAVGLTGCGAGKQAAKKSVRIGITLYDQYDLYLSQMMSAFTNYAADLESETNIAITLDIQDAAANQLTQNAQVDGMIRKGCDVICVNLVDRTDPATITELAEKNNVPVIFFNRELVEEDLESWDRLYYVGANAFESGIMEGEILAEKWKSDAELDRNGDGILQYFVLEGEAGHQDAIVRTEYAINTLIEEGIEVEKLGYAIANWTRAQAQTKTTQALTQYPDRIEAIIANNDAMALGAIDVLKMLEVPKEQWPVIIGIDGVQEGLEAVADKEMIGTVYNDKEGQAEQMLQLAFRVAKGEDPSDLECLNGKYIRLDYAKITLDNVADYLKTE